VNIETGQLTRTTVANTVQLQAFLSFVLFVVIQ